MYSIFIYIYWIHWILIKRHKGILIFTCGAFGESFLPIITARNNYLYFQLFITARHSKYLSLKWKHYNTRNKQLCRTIFALGICHGQLWQKNWQIYNLSFIYCHLFIMTYTQGHYYDSFSQSLWYISQIRIEILKTTGSIFTSLCRLCTSKKQFLISLNKLQMLWFIHINDYVQFSPLSYIIICLCWSKCIAMDME